MEALFMEDNIFLIRGKQTGQPSRPTSKALHERQYQQHTQGCSSQTNLTSSRLISSLLNVNPGITPLFFSQKIAAKEPEKKMPSTAAKAMIRSAKDESSSLIHRIAQSALRFTHGIVSTALKRKSLQNNTRQCCFPWTSWSLYWFT